MKKLSKIAVFVLAAVIAFGATACKSKTYTVTYDVGEHGVAMDSETFTISEPFDFKDPERKAESKGYAFAGWYKNKNFLGAAIFGTEDLTGDATVYADWQIANYNISYTLNGGALASGSPTSYTYFEGVSLIDASRTGYIFDGWFTDKDFKNEAVTSIAQGQEGNKRFWAKWTKLEAGQSSIEYDLDGGKWNGIYPSYYTEGSELELTTPEKTGFTFVGWYTAKTGGTKVTKILATDTGTKKLYASWSIITYTITYNPNGGTFPTTYKQSYTFIDSLFFLPTLTKTGSDFGGWYANSSFTGENQSYIKANSLGNKEFYAKWLTITTNSATTTKFEAENVDLSYFNGAGYSGSQSGAGTIISDPGASGGRYVGYLNSADLFIEYQIKSDRAVSGVTITLAVNFEQIKGIYELTDITLSPSAFAVIVSGVEYTYASKVVKAGDDPNKLFYTNIPVNNVSLVAGENIVKLLVRMNTLWGGEREAGPGIDCISITTTSTLSWTPIPN